MGTNKGLFDLLILVPWLTYLVNVRNGKTRILTYLWKNKILFVFSEYSCLFFLRISS